VNSAAIALTATVPIDRSSPTGMPTAGEGVPGGTRSSRSRVGANRRAGPRGLGSGADRRAVATPRAAAHQPREHLSPDLAGQTEGGTLYRHLRGAQKLKRKRYGACDSRGRLAGKRPITARPPGAEKRSRFGHWEGDTVLGAGQAGPCILTLVERKSGFVAIGQLQQRTAPFVNTRAHQLIAAQPGRCAPSPSITAPSSTATPISRHVSEPGSTSLPLITPGNVAPTRTRTDCYANICRKERAWLT